MHDAFLRRETASLRSVTVLTLVFLSSSALSLLEGQPVSDYAYRTGDYNATKTG